MDTISTSRDVFIPLDQPEQVDQLVERSFTQPVVLFKHSPTCGISAYAYEELQAYRAEPAALEIHLVDVKASRPISQEIAARFKVHHESPQILLLVNGQVTWHTSHYSINTSAIKKALDAAR